MELLIAILMCLGLYATPDQLSNEEFKNNNRETIDYGSTVIQNNWYYYGADGGIVIDPGVGT
ncbi:MAG: hypothetical protein ABI855_10035 [Bacteroidota bacterium]